MKKRLFYTSLHLIALCILFVSCDKSNDTVNIETGPLYSQNDVLKATVQTNTTNLATGLNAMFTEHFTDSTGRAALTQAFAHNSWYLNDNSGYTFVESLNAYNIAHPFEPALEGSHTIGQTDAYGKEIVVEMINTARHIGFGFIEYFYENPASQEIQEKTTFVNIIPEAGWYAGAGYYHSNNPALVKAEDKNKEIVKQCVISMAGGMGAVLEEFATDSLHGVELMRTFLQHIRFFDDQSGYFYVIDFSGYNVCQPPDPDFQGTYEWDFQDSRGTYLVRGLIETAQNGGGFYSYYWEEYQTGTEKLKTAYVKQIPGKDYLIGSGVYIE